MQIVNRIQILSDKQCYLVSDNSNKIIIGFYNKSELRIVRSAWERNYVTDVCHTSNEQ